MQAAVVGPSQRWLLELKKLGAWLIARVLGTADGWSVANVASRELALILRSRGWRRHQMGWLGLSSATILVPMIVRMDWGDCRFPPGREWFLVGGYGLQCIAFLTMVQWTARRLRLDLRTHRLEELLLTRCSAADVAMGEALASAVASVWMIGNTLPACLLLCAFTGHGLDTAVRLTLSLAPAAALGVWFGMGWGLAFALRRTQSLVPLTQWWVMGPALPIVVAWSLLGGLGVAWAALSLVPGGQQALGWVVRLLWVGVAWVARHFNPFLTVGAAGGEWGSTWWSDWISLIAITTFMMRKSMDEVDRSLNVVPDEDPHHYRPEHWIHHDVHYFMQFGDNRRRIPNYRDGGNAVTAFDVALGHRVYLHPFLWACGLMLYLFLIGWSLLLPSLGRWTATVAVLIPATAALLLMSGGVAVSFGWERERERWQALASLPMSNFTLALGKIRGVVSPTLWTSLMSVLTAALMGWRGALEPESALWMMWHVLVFPLTLASVSAALALATPSLGEAVYRWIILGAAPCVLFFAPPPVGGLAGLALPFSPPLAVLLIAILGPIPLLERAVVVAAGLELIGLVGSLGLLALFLRRWTIAER